MGKFFSALFEDLSIYVRHLAWLNAIPDKPDGDKSKRVEVSRREALRQSGIDEPEMPIVDAGYILSYLWELGPTMSSGGYPGTVTHEEILAWQELSGIKLHPWEAHFLRALSGEYLEESQLATKRNRPAPWKADREEEFLAVAISMRQSIRALANL